MQGAILAILVSAAAISQAQVTSTYVAPIPPTTSVVTYKTIRCSTYYGDSKVKPVRRTTLGVTTNYPETIYPYVYVNSTSTASTCYSSYGSEPTVSANIAAAVTRFPTAVYCTKSVSIVRVTYAASPTSTLTRTIVAYPTNDPEGLQWAIYPNNEGSDTDSTYSLFEPKAFTNSTPYYQSTSPSIGGFVGNGSAGSGFAPFYGSAIAFNQSYFVINHRWYLKAQQSGTYSVSIPSVNDIALLWIGAQAYSNYSRATAVQTVTSSNTTHISYSFQAVAGQYLPMRLIYGQASDVYSLSFLLTGPDGSTLLGPNTSPSQAVIQYGCSGYTSPAVPFPDFGFEQYSYTYTFDG